MFDSNIWQIVVSPEKYTKDPHVDKFRVIHNAILQKKIIPFLSETIFTLEAIKKIERQNFFAQISPKIVVNNKIKNDIIISSISLGPNEKDAINFDNRPILKSFFEDAIRIKFNIVRLPLMGGLVNPDVDKVLYKPNDLDSYHNRVFEIVEKIENAGAGKAQIKEIGGHYGSGNFMTELKKAPESDWKKIAKAAAEWADGDSVAISIALDCNYFCTRDTARGAGSKSVLSKANLEWLKDEYNFETITPEKLAEILMK